MGTVHIIALGMNTTWVSNIYIYDWFDAGYPRGGISGNPVAEKPETTQI